MKSLATLVILFAGTSLLAQQPEAIDLGQFYNVDAPQRSYDNLTLELSSSPELQQQKGWKYIARWYDYASRHLGADGRPIGQAEYVQALQSYESFQKASQGGRANSWSPAGPFEAPVPTSPTLFTGTGRINTITFHPTDPDIMWIGAGQGGLWKSTNGGESWFPLGDDLPVMRISDITVNPANPDEMYICVGDFAYLAYWIETRDVKRNTHFGLGVYKSMDGGVTWQPTGLSTEFSDKDASLTRRTFISADNDDIVLAAGMKGVFISGDRGGAWNKVLDGEIWDIEQDPSDPNTLYASTGFIRNLEIGNATLWKSTDFGESWSKLNTGIPEQWEAQRLEIAISPADPDYVYIVACDLGGGLYGVYRSVDGGSSWELRANSPNILHWLNGTGQGGQGTYDLAVLAHPDDRDKLSVGGVNQWISEDGGMTWHGVSYYTGGFGGPAVHADHHFLKFNDHDSMIYLCHDGGVSRTREIIPGSWDSIFQSPDYNWPTQWEHLNNGLANMAFYRLGISQTESRNIYAGAQDMGTFLRRDESNWTYHTLGDGMECIISPLSDDILFGSSQYGNLFRSDDGGQSFGGLGQGNRPWQQESAEWTTPFMVGHDNPLAVYVGASNVWFSGDNGDSFFKASDFSIYPISALDVAPSNAGRIYVGKRVWYGDNQPGEIWRLENDQTTWTDISDGTPVDSIYISYLEVDDENENLIWATFAGFADGAKVYESDNGGTTWRNISFNLPNVPANCIITHPGADHNPLYVAMDRGVYYKNDTMDRWDLYSEGLPNVIVSELEIHTDDQMLYISTFGRGVWMNNLLDQISSSSSGPLVLPGSMVISPNPTNGPINVSVSDIPAGSYTLEMISTSGQLVANRLIEVPATTHTDLKLEAPVVSGLYYVRLRGEAGMRVEKVLVTD